MKLGIFTAYRNFHKRYIQACEHLGVEYEVVDILAPDWLKRVEASDCDGFLCRPPSKFEERNRQFDERLYFVNKKMNRPIYPGYDELMIYENKRFTAYWLAYHNFPHPKTQVFYRKEDFADFVNQTRFPFVIKINTGTSSKGVKIVKRKLTANIISKLAFGMRNNKLTIGYSPQMSGKIIKFPALGTIQKHHLIVQEYLKIKWEWRIVKIDGSYFGHKKLKRGEFASGTRLKGWDTPPEELLLMTQKICETGNFYSMDVDYFETEDGEFYVNELQSLFGQSTEHLMYVNDKPGRFVYKNGKFEFEEGNFNQYESYLLRVKHFIKILNEQGVKS